jgi:hypothetical protein
MKINEYLEALQHGESFDWICNHGYELNKYELIDIVKELTYAISSMGICDGKEDIFDTAYENLIDTYDEVD